MLSILLHLKRLLSSSSLDIFLTPPPSSNKTVCLQGVGQGKDIDFIQLLEGETILRQDERILYLQGTLDDDVHQQGHRNMFEVSLWLTNFRLLFSRPSSTTADKVIRSLPLGTIYNLEIIRKLDDLDRLTIYCKDFRTIIITFPSTTEIAKENQKITKQVHKQIKRLAFTTKYASFFAFQNKQRFKPISIFADDRNQEQLEIVQAESAWTFYNIYHEYRRLKLTEPWKASIPPPPILLIFVLWGEVFY